MKSDEFQENRKITLRAYTQVLRRDQRIWLHSPTKAKEVREEHKTHYVCEHTLSAVCLVLYIPRFQHKREDEPEKKDRVQERRKQLHHGLKLPPSRIEKPGGPF